MELWIRSQDKEILQTSKGVCILDTATVKTTLDNGKWSIFDNKNMTNYGVYKTKERALEVLDEIKSCLETNSLFNLYSNIGAIPTDFNQKWNYVAVYQMPKE